MARWKPGQSGNPQGRPPGSKNAATRVTAAERLLNDQAEALAQKAIDLALAGDTVALGMCLERVIPIRQCSACGTSRGR